MRRDRVRFPRPLRRAYRAARHAWRPALVALRRRRGQREVQRSVALRPEDRSDKRRRMHVLVDLVHERLPARGLRVVEIGTRTGRTSRHLARYCPQIETIFAVDPEPPPPGAFDGLARVRFVQGWSDAVAKEFDDASLDLVFIDADHSEEGVRSDLAAWMPKVRPGGIVAGHDYARRHHPGVKPAVDGFFREHRHPVRLEADKVWWTTR
ncbi:MAG TPA: class I SAM-dependent methyltransferase [Myxococcota bacterium]|nr:class I SAM-dependent methyltransferase [Myxococcota bacterium]